MNAYWELQKKELYKVRRLLLAEQLKRNLKPLLNKKSRQSNLKEKGSNTSERKFKFIPVRKVSDGNYERIKVE